MANVKGGIINPNATNSLVLFLLGSIVAGFAAGLGWGLASKMLEKSGNEYETYRARRLRAMKSIIPRGRYYPMPIGKYYPTSRGKFIIS